MHADARVFLQVQCIGDPLWHRHSRAYVTVHGGSRQTKNKQQLYSN
jgi:hypothetical protein